MNDDHNLIAGFRLRIICLLVIRYFIYSSAIIGFLLGVSLLLLRVVCLVQRAYLLLSLLIFVPVFLLSLLAAFLKMPSVRSLKCLFDNHNRCGGLLMASDEVDLGFWKSSITHLACPKISWKARKTWGLFILAVMFVIAGFLIPQKYVQIASARPFKIGEDIEKLTEQIEALKEENIIMEKTAEDFEKTLEEVKKTASGSDPIKTWETLDHIQQSLKKQAQDAANLALSQTENIAKAETLSEALSESGSELNAKVSAEAAAELSALVKSLAGQNEQLKDRLDPNTLNTLEQGQLNGEQLSQLTHALNCSKQNLSGSISKMCQAGLIDVNSILKCQALGQCDANSLKECLAKDANSMSISEMLSMCCGVSGRRPGRGGVNRGRADAPMTWTEGSSEEGAKFKEKILPPASLDALKDSMTVSVSISEPVVEKGLESTTNGDLGSASADSGQAVTRKILPRHKGTVKRYFERQQK